MKSFIGLITIVVRDYDEALNYYRSVLNFELVEDTPLSETQRWVVIRPKNSGELGCRLLLAQAADDQQAAFIGDQTGGRVFLFLYTDNIEAYLDHLQENKVNIVHELRTEPYGKVLVFRDLYGNLWDLIQPA